MDRKRAALALAALILAILAREAAACAIAPGWTPPPLAEWLARSPVVFIGTVLSSGWPEERMVVGSPPREVIFGRRTPELVKARFQVEVALRGVSSPKFEVRQGETSCDNEFQPGERWLFVGTRNGSFIFGGSRVLRTGLGTEFSLRANDRDALLEAFPGLRSIDALPVER
jgi:hypothetical protein